MLRLLDGLYRGLLYLGALCMISTLACILLGVAGRQFGFEIQGLDGYAGYSIAASLFLALPATLRHGDHIRVSLLLNRLSGTPRTIADYWCLAAAVGISGYLAWFAVRLVWLSNLMHDVSQASDATPLWIPQLAMAVGCIGLFVAFVEELVLKLLGRPRTVVPSADMARAE